MMLSRMEAGKKGGGGSSRQKKLLKDVETINKALYLDRTSSRSSIPSANSRSKFTGKSQLPDPKSKSKASGDNNDDGVQKDKRSIWNWRPLRALSHIRNKRFNCSFYLQVHLIEGLPPSFDDASLAVYWKRRDGVLVTGPAKVIQSVAEFEEKLTYTCSVYGSRSGPHHSAKYEAKHFLLYASLLSAPELDLGKHRVDLTRLLPLTLEELEEEKSSGKWTTSFRLMGVAKGAVMNVSFGYMVVSDNASATRDSHNAPNVLTSRQNSLSLMKTDAKPKQFDGSSRIRRATSMQYSPQAADEVKDLHEVLPSSKSSLASSIDILYKKIDEEKACNALHDEVELDSFTENLEPIKPDAYASELGKERPEEHVGKDENACPVQDKPEVCVFQEKLETAKSDVPLQDSTNENPEQYQDNEFSVVDKGIELSSNEPVELEESVIKAPEDASTVDTACTFGISGIQVSSEDSVEHDFLNEANDTSKEQIEVEEFASINAPEDASTVDTASTLGISGIQVSSEDSIEHDFLDEANDLDTSELLLQELESALNSVSNLERVALESPKTTEANYEHKMAKSHSLDDVTESVTSEFLSMLGLDRSPMGLSSESEPESPREQLLRQFEKEALDGGFSSLFDFDMNYDNEEEGGYDTSAASEQWNFPEGVKSSSFFQDLQEEHLVESKDVKSKQRAHVLEDLETEALMREWGLNEKAFHHSPPKDCAGFGSPIHLPPEQPPTLPPLDEGLGPFLQTKDGGFVRSMNPSLFKNSKSGGSLIMQVSNPVVVPAEMGSGIMQVMQCLASVGIEKLSMQAKELMPLEDITGKTMQQVAWEALPVLEGAERLVCPICICGLDVSF